MHTLRPQRQNTQEPIAILQNDTDLSPTMPNVRAPFGHTHLTEDSSAIGDSQSSVAKLENFP